MYYQLLFCLAALLTAVSAAAQPTGTPVVSCLTPDSVRVQLWLVKPTISVKAPPVLIFAATNQSRKPQRMLLGAAGHIGGIEGLGVAITNQRTSQLVATEHKAALRSTLWTPEKLEPLKTWLRSGETRRVTFNLYDVVSITADKQTGHYLPAGSYALRFYYARKGSIEKPMPGTRPFGIFPPLPLVVQPSHHLGRNHKKTRRLIQPARFYCLDKAVAQVVSGSRMASS